MKAELKKKVLLSAITILIVLAMLTVPPVQATVYSAHADNLNCHMDVIVDTTANTLKVKWWDENPGGLLHYYYFGSYIHIWDDYGQIYWFDAPLGCHIAPDEEMTFTYAKTDVDVHAEVKWCYQIYGHYLGFSVTVKCDLNVPPQSAYTLSISATSGGTTNPSPGTYTYDSGSSVTVTAKPNSGYEFWYWVVDGDTTNYTPEENPITITMDQDHTLEAYFYYKSTCPTLFVWNGTDYAEEGALDIHADLDVTVQHEIQNTLALKNGVYNLQLRELENNTSHIDQVELYAVDYEGGWHLCPLIYAKHNDSYVTWKLLFDDEKRIDLTPTQIVNLKFLPAIASNETAQFIFEINGYNMK